MNQKQKQSEAYAGKLPLGRVAKTQSWNSIAQVALHLVQVHDSSTSSFRPVLLFLGAYHPKPSSDAEISEASVALGGFDGLSEWISGSFFTTHPNDSPRILEMPRFG